ncbi:MAG: hypothetical protein L0Y72_11565 [Gemmataceae bacterium]|nr:hypothetical protein [Gemmataceae bacterium]
MPKTRKRPARDRKPKTSGELAQELSAVRTEVELLRDKYTKMNRTLLRLCCPKEWFDEEVDDEKVWSKAIWEPTLREVIDSLK